MKYRYFFPLVLLFLSAISQTASQESWQSLSTPHFQILHREKDRGTAQRVAEASENALEYLQRTLGGRLGRKVDIYIATNEKTLLSLLPPGNDIPDWIAGLAFPAQQKMILKSWRMMRGREVQFETLFRHELTHILLYRLTGSGRRSVPRWFEEGLAVYLSGESGFNQIPSLVLATTLNHLIPLQELAAGFPQESHAAHKAYAQSGNLIAYLVNQEGARSLRYLIEEIRRTGDFALAFEITFGKSIPTVEQEWQQYLKIRFTWLPLAGSGVSLWSLAAILVFIGHLRKRRRHKRILEQWEQEERMIYKDHRGNGTWLVWDNDVDSDTSSRSG